MTNDINHPFMCLLAMWVISEVSVLFSEVAIAILFLLLQFYCLTIKFWKYSEFFMYFGQKSLIKYMSCKYFLPPLASLLSFGQCFSKSRWF